MARRAWSRPLFHINFPGAETSVSVRRALSAMDRGNPSLKKLLDVCDSMKLKVESPTFLRDCWAHIGIPAKKIAIFMRQSTDGTTFEKVRRLWEGNGWKILLTTTRQIDQMTEDELAENLKAEIGGRR